MKRGMKCTVSQQVSYAECSNRYRTRIKVASRLMQRPARDVQCELLRTRVQGEGLQCSMFNVNVLVNTDI